MRTTLFRSSPALLVSLFSACASAQLPATALDFRDAPFTAVIQAVADGTGQRFIVDPSIHSHLTMLSPGPLSPDSMWQAFNAMLEIQGLEVRRVGRDLRIAPARPDAPTTAATAVTPAAGEPGRVVASSVRSLATPRGPDIVVAEPAVANGSQRGLRVSAGTDAVEFDRLGLDPGDVVLTVNGTALTDPTSSKAVLDSALAASGDVTVKLERAGRVQELILYTARL